MVFYDDAYERTAKAAKERRKSQFRWLWGSLVASHPLPSGKDMANIAVEAKNSLKQLLDETTGSNCVVSIEPPERMDPTWLVEISFEGSPEKIEFEMERFSLDEAVTGALAWANYRTMSNAGV